MGPNSIINHFGNLTDPREDNKRHNLIDIIVITICAVIWSADKWENIEAYGTAKEKWLCPICKQRLYREDELDIHHLRMKIKGGKDTLNNLVLLHGTFHRQLHASK